MEQQEFKKMTFVAAIRSFFGQKPGQTMPEFAQELKALTPEDRVYFINELRTAGIDATGGM